MSTSAALRGDAALHAHRKTTACDLLPTADAASATVSAGKDVPALAVDGGPASEEAMPPPNPVRGHAEAQPPNEVRAPPPAPPHADDAVGGAEEPATAVALADLPFAQARGVHVMRVMDDLLVRPRRRPRPRDRPGTPCMCMTCEGCAEAGSSEGA